MDPFAAELTAAVEWIGRQPIPDALEPTLVTMCYVGCRLLGISEMALTSEDKEWLSNEIERLVRDAIRETTGPRFDTADSTRTNILKHLAGIASATDKVLNAVRAPGSSRASSERSD